MSDNGTSWEVVHDEPGKSIRRYPVPGGWLYQSESTLISEPMSAATGTRHRGWGNAVFVQAFDATGKRVDIP